PDAAVAAEQARERLANLGAAEGFLGEERQLPAVERFTELAVGVGERQLVAQVAREPRPDLVEPRDVTARLGGSDRQERRDAQRPEVEPLEDDRARGDRACGREPERADRVGELGGCVGWI